MSRWYRAATVCYAYLSDVDDISGLHQSRYFTRGWTLQELIAPSEVLFYSARWRLIGGKVDLSSRLSEITDIERDVLATGNFDHINIATRMSWAGKRKTTRIEDIAYSLMGIFDVNMPLLYGEGKKAFTRLQEEIMKVSDDATLFAWGLASTIRTISKDSPSEFWRERRDTSRLHGLFADSPSDFTLCRQIRPVMEWETDINPAVTRGGVKLTLPMWNIEWWATGLKNTLKFPMGSNALSAVAALPFTIEGAYEHYLCLPLVECGKLRFARWEELFLIHERDIGQPVQLLVTPPPRSGPVPLHRRITHYDIQGINTGYDKLNYRLEGVYCLPNALYSAQGKTITLLDGKEGPHAMLLLKSSLVPTTGPNSPTFAIVLGSESFKFKILPWIRLIHIVDGESDCKSNYALGREKQQNDSYVSALWHEVVSSLANNSFYLGRLGVYYEYCGLLNEKISATTHMRPYYSILSHTHHEEREQTRQASDFPLNFQQTFVNIHFQREVLNLLEEKIVLSVWGGTEKPREY